MISVEFLEGVFKCYNVVVPKYNSFDVFVLVRFELQTWKPIYRGDWFLWIIQIFYYLFKFYFIHSNWFGQFAMLQIFSPYLIIKNYNKFYKINKIKWCPYWAFLSSHSEFDFLHCSIIIQTQRIPSKIKFFKNVCSVFFLN